MATTYTTMVCSRCKQETDDFAPHVTLGRQAYCRPCMKLYKAARRDRCLANERCRRYGITPDDQWAMFHAQQERCAACGCPLTFASAQLDHNHETGAVRAFLCRPCNQAIGTAEESVQRLLACADYLNQQKFWVRDI